MGAHQGGHRTRHTPPQVSWPPWPQARPPAVCLPTPPHTPWTSLPQQPWVEAPPCLLVCMALGVLPGWGCQSVLSASSPLLSRELSGPGEELLD